MRRAIRLPAAALALLVALVSGCATAPAFKHPWTEGLELGSTTERAIRARLGEPRSTRTLRVYDSRSVTVLQYSEVELHPEVAHARTILYSFHEGRLVGYSYASSFSADNTDFDDSAADRLVKGHTTEEQVLSLLGRPTGRSIYPLVKELSLRSVNYNYSHTERIPGGTSSRTKTLIVTFDRRGVVIEVSLNVFPVGI